MDGGGVLLERNPLKGLTLPKEETPKRAIVTGEQYQALRKVAVRRGPLLELIRILCHDTGHRVGGVRRLRWSDIDLERRTVHWRGEYDKLGKDHVTPLANDAVAAPTNVRRMQKTIGDTWIFPAKTDPQRHWSRGGVERRWKWMAKRAGLPIDQRYGWHALRRQFATALKAHPAQGSLCAGRMEGQWNDPHVLSTARRVHATHRALAAEIAASRGAQVRQLSPRIVPSSSQDLTRNGDSKPQPTA